VVLWFGEKYYENIFICLLRLRSMKVISVCPPVVHSSHALCGNNVSIKENISSPASFSCSQRRN